ncbi:MAG: fibronectin type III domain-containing protein [Nitrospiria bacterium]
MNRKHALVVFLFLVTGTTACIRSNREPPLKGEATLSWSANSDADLAGYKIHFGTTSGTYTTTFDAGLTETPSKPSITVRGLTKGVTYYFAVTAYNRKGVESGYSPEISKLIE